MVADYFSQKLALKFEEGLRDTSHKLLVPTNNSSCLILLAFSDNRTTLCRMFKWLRILINALRSAFMRRRDLALENVALRQQLAVYKQTHPRPRLSDVDRRFWVLLARIWHGWRATLHIVQPETVVRWHRHGFRCYWRWKSRRRGRPAIDPEIVHLIRRMCRANPLWGAPRIHGELLKLGIEVCETTVAKYMIMRRGPPSQAWKTFLENHVKETMALDFYMVPTATFKVLFVFVILSHDRRRILHFNVSELSDVNYFGRSVTTKMAGR